MPGFASHWMEILWEDRKMFATTFGEHFSLTVHFTQRSEQHWIKNSKGFSSHLTKLQKLSLKSEKFHFFVDRENWCCALTGIQNPADDARRCPNLNFIVWRSTFLQEGRESWPLRHYLCDADGSEDGKQEIAKACLIFHKWISTYILDVESLSSLRLHEC